ncbi:pseudaminic acid synthase [Gramella sp. Hel_I_59]|uniref:pseudaminic acid synthase n=1 Tax=Gramella sp. Hel_I_59 TaxID=1249978 RepID=UPI0011528208|nr:pseudaminic acid synthase [Gramella sp. Hel_I_59]TQI70420.1 pseudaminic acid synthase [Gramella sp. Hel_I_59]
MKIAEFEIEKGSSVFIVAELSANHGGDIEIAKASIRAAKRAGADAVKLQTYTADSMTLDVKTDDFKLKHGTSWDGYYLYDLYKAAFTPWSWHKELFDTAREVGLICFSSPFDKEAVELLEELNTPAYKIASFEITDIPLIELVASKGKPVIISTGIADLEDIQLALDACHRMGNKDIVLLKCTSQYPAPIEDANMVMVNDLSDRFEVASGLSDHTIGNTAPIAATCLGAQIIEKHFILDKSVGGPDASFSMDENEFSAMVKAVREAEKVLGSINYELSENQKIARSFSRSIYVTNDIKRGEKITTDNIRAIRPGYGLHPKYFKDIQGKSVKKDLLKGTALSLDHIE